MAVRAIAHLLALHDGGDDLGASVPQPPPRMAPAGRVPAARAAGSVGDRDMGRRWTWAGLMAAVAALAVLVAPGWVAAQEPDDEGQAADAPPWVRLRDGVQVARTTHFDVFVPRGSPL